MGKSIKVPPRTTATEFRTFQRTIRDHYERVGLTAWSIYTTHELLMSTRLAEMTYDTASRVARITLNRCPCATDVPIEVTAKHELAHLLLADLVDVAENRFSTQAELDREVERITVVGIWALWRQVWETGS